MVGAISGRCDLLLTLSMPPLLYHNKQIYTNIKQDRNMYVVHAWNVSSSREATHI
jgi:hypothetical protein